MSSPHPMSSPLAISNSIPTDVSTGASRAGTSKLIATDNVFRPTATLLSLALTALPFVLAIATAVLWSPSAIRAQTSADAAKTDIDSRTEALFAAIDEGRLDFAESEIRDLLLGGDSAALLDLLAVVLSRQGKLDEAESTLARAMELDPNFAPAQAHMGRLQLMRGDQTGALSYLRRAAELGPLERELALALASAELGAGNLESAEVQLRSVAERFQSVSALLELARLSSRRGDPKTAFQALEKAVQVAPNSEDVLSAYGRLALRLRLPVPAIQAFEPLCRMFEQEPEYFYLLGVSRLQVGDLDGAIEVLSDSLRLDGESSLPWIAMGLAFNRQNRHADATEALERGIRYQPDSPEALAALAEAREGLGELDGALEAASRALELQPDNPTALLVVGTVALARDDPEGAQAALRRAITEDPDSAKAHYQLSLALARTGDSEASARHRQLYAKARQASEERLVSLRRALGLETDEPSSSPRDP